MFTIKKENFHSKQFHVSIVNQSHLNCVLIFHLFGMEIRIRQPVKFWQCINSVEHLLQFGVLLCFSKCILIWLLFPLVFCADIWAKIRNSKNIFERQKKTENSVQNGTNCWNFIYPFGQKSHCVCAFFEPALPTDPISPRFQSACCNQTPCFFSAALVVHSRRTTFLFKFFRFTPHSDGVKRTGTFHKSQEKSTHMQIFSIAPEI